MKVEVELEDNIYLKVREIFGDDVDLGQLMGQMFGALLVIMATYPEDFMAVFTRQASPEQRQRIDDAMARLTPKVLERAKKVRQ